MAAAQDLLDPQPATLSFAQSPLGRNFLLGLGLASVLALMAATFMWVQQPEYRVLFSNFTDRDGGAITASLEQMGVPHKFSEGGGAIMVPADKVHDVRLKLAAQGLPKGGNVGFELMENQKLGVSQFLEQVNYQRSLEGELARSIQSLAAVSAARVHLALPKPSVFVRDVQKPTASVLLNLQQGRVLDAGQVSAIVHLVASSVPELPVSNVTVVDQAGNLLSDAGTKLGGKQLDPNQFKYVSQIQQGIVKQIESLITPLVGPGNVRAEATAEIDFAQVDTAAETYTPNSPPAASAMRSQTTSEAGNTPPAAAGVPGALSNQPPGSATAPLTTVPGTAPAPAPAVVNGRRDATTNYEVDKTIRYEQKPMGGIKRLTVGVAVNHRRSIDPRSGRVTVTALTAAEVAQINSLVREAMGFNQQRGDSLTVHNVPFDGVDKPVEAVAATPWYLTPEAFYWAKLIGKWLLGAIILAFLFFRVLRPMLRPVMRRIDQIADVPAYVPQEADEMQARDRAQRDSLDLQQHRGYRENLALAKNLAANDPRVVANVVKSWVGGSNE